MLINQVYLVKLVQKMAKIHIQLQKRIFSTDLIAVFLEIKLEFISS